MILGLDDTDSVDGGCTTHAAFELVRRLEGIDLIGPPRLVRLNPNVPHKTRGNGAVALRLGHGRGTPAIVGEDGGRPIHAYAAGEPLRPAEAERVFGDAQRWIRHNARLDDPRTHPGLVAFGHPPPAAWYDDAVHRYVGLREVHDGLGRADARFAGWKLGRGLVGASAAAAWPAWHGTFEWISYRHRERWGSPRRLDAGLGPDLDRHHPSTFDNHDPETGHLRVAPASPCPVLGGVRGLDREDVRRAAGRLGPEEAAGGLLFATNQATDDHARLLTGAALRPFMAVSLETVVAGVPIDRPGGHVFLRTRSDDRDVDVVAFEPTGGLRGALRDLRAGDRMRLVGGTHEDPGLVALEKFILLRASERTRRRAPDCPSCGRRMASRGRDAPHRCPGCGRRDVPPVTLTMPGPREGAYEAPVRVRRHLTRPLGLPALVEDIAAL